MSDQFREAKAKRDAAIKELQQAFAAALVACDEFNQVNGAVYRRYYEAAQRATGYPPGASWQGIATEMMREDGLDSFYQMTPDDDQGVMAALQDRTALLTKRPPKQRSVYRVVTAAGTHTEYA